MIEELIQVPTEDNCRIALWKIYDKESQSDKNIFLTHGTFSNRNVLNRIAQFLVAHQYVCWIMEWRDHGASIANGEAFNFERIALYDCPAVFNYLVATEKIQSLSCLTHSGGGIILTMFLIKHQAYIDKINCMVLFACQAFAAAYTRKKYFLILIAKYLTAFLGKLPAKFAGAKGHDERYFMMKQWFDWNLSKSFKGKNDFDYLEQMPKLTMPILSICAAGDQYIAPTDACHAFLQGYKNKNNECLYYAKANGNLDDYNHGRVLNSKNAQLEIWLKALEWFAKNG